MDIVGPEGDKMKCGGGSQVDGLVGGRRETSGVATPRELGILGATESIAPLGCMPVSTDEVAVENTTGIEDGARGSVLIWLGVAACGIPRLFFCD